MRVQVPPRALPFSPNIAPERRLPAHPGAFLPWRAPAGWPPERPVKAKPEASAGSPPVLAGLAPAGVVTAPPEPCPMGTTACVTSHRPGRRQGGRQRARSGFRPLDRDFFLNRLSAVPPSIEGRSPVPTKTMGRPHCPVGARRPNTDGLNFGFTSRPNLSTQHG
mgnify:CR=1 FL=1